MQSRRDVLRTGAGIAAVGGLTSLAGCSSVPVVGSFFEDAPDYTQWAYDPEEMDSSSTAVVMGDVDSILSADAYPEQGKSNIRDSISETFEDELEAEDVEYQLSVGFSNVYIGSFDPSAVLDAMSLSEADGYGDFDVYENDEDQTTYFATDGDVLVSSHSIGFFNHDGRDELEVLIDTYSGDADSFADTNDDFGRLTDELETSDIVRASGSTEAGDDGTVAKGFTTTIDGEDASGKFVVIYGDESDVDLDAVKKQVEQDRGKNVEIGDPSQDGRVVAVEYSMPTEELVNASEDN